MEIIETGLSFTGLCNRESTNRIILHHAEANTCSAEDIHNWHKDNGWGGAGYHFLIRKNGKIYRLRPEKAIGAHAKGSNYNSIGICFEGSYNVETMPDAQIVAGQELVAYLQSKYGISTVQKHSDVNSTDCPGKNFPFAQISTWIDGEDFGVSASLEKLVIDGYFGNKTISALQRALGTTVDGIVSGQDLRDMTAIGGRPTNAWQIGKGGSLMVASMQRRLGNIEVDGFFGRNTCIALQRALNAKDDGIISKPSACVKKLQQRLNDGELF